MATFDTEPVQEEEMRARIAEISSRFPYFVYEEDKEITGYCYAHTWKERSAYRYTLETTVYLSPGHTGKGTKVGLKFDRWLDVADYELLLLPTCG